jgi:hypothetical protein
MSSRTWHLAYGTLPHDLLLLVNCCFFLYKIRLYCSHSLHQCCGQPWIIAPFRIQDWTHDPILLPKLRSWLAATLYNCLYFLLCNLTIFFLTLSLFLPNAVLQFIFSVHYIFEKEGESYASPKFKQDSVACLSIKKKSTQQVHALRAIPKHGIPGVFSFNDQVRLYVMHYVSAGILKRHIIFLWKWLIQTISEISWQLAYLSLTWLSMVSVSLSII